MHGATGTSYNYEYRMHDPRVGRFLSVDPLANEYPFYSPYAFSGNRVIDKVELEGLEPAPAVSGDEVEGETTTTTTESYARAGVRNTRTWNWTYHQGGVNGTRAGWMLDDDYAEDVIKPLAKDYIAWEDGTGNGDLWSGFSVDRGGGWGGAISQAADYQRANPTYDGLKSFIPIWGAANQAYLDFSAGKNGWGTFNAALAVSDVFLVKSIFTGVSKGGLLAFSKGNASWGGRNGYRAFYGKSGFASKGQDVHHWLIPRNEWGRGVPNLIKNQMWNLMPFKSRSLHFRAGHGWNYLGESGMSIGGQLWFGTPLWPKLTLGSYGGRFLEYKIR